MFFFWHFYTYLVVFSNYLAITRQKTEEEEKILLIAIKVDKSKGMDVNPVQPFLPNFYHFQPF